MPPEKAPWTVLDVIQWTARYFTSRQVESPRLSAELLLAHALGLDRLDLYLDFARPLEQEERATMRGLVKRRAAGEPVAYITGEKGFWESSFEVTPAVLVPRPDTETLVESALAELSGRSADGLTVWEPATGSGAVVLSLAAAEPDVRFLASDRCPAALAVARRNAARHHLLDRVAFFAADWFAGLRPGGMAVDLIVVNPPYVAAAEIENLAPEIRNHEPRQALDGGHDGLAHVRHIIDQAADFLGSGGLLLMEIGWDQRAAVTDLGAASGRYAAVDFIRDLAGHDRVVRLAKKS